MDSTGVKSTHPTAGRNGGGAAHVKSVKLAIHGNLYDYIKLFLDKTNTMT